MKAVLFARLANRKDAGCRDYLGASGIAAEVAPVGKRFLIDMMVCSNLRSMIPKCA